MKITLSVIKADIGGWVGHCSMHPDLMAEGEACMAKAKKSGLLIDYHVTRCGDDLQFIMTHKKGIDNCKIHEMAWNAFQRCTAIAKKLKLHGAGQDLLSDAFSGNVKGQGPGVAEMEINEREAEPVIVFMADKTASGAWNLPLYSMFCDPFNTIGLVISANMHGGFKFEVHDVKESKRIMFNCPEEIYDMLVFIGAPSRYTVKSVYSRETGEIAATSSTQKLSLHRRALRGQGRPCLHRAGPGHLPGRRRGAGAFRTAAHRGGLDARFSQWTAHTGLGEGVQPHAFRRSAARHRSRLPACRRQAGRAGRHVRRRGFR